MVPDEGVEQAEEGRIQMNLDIECPFCGFRKSVERSRIPPGARYIRCPKCGQRSSFERKEASDACLSAAGRAEGKASSDQPESGIFATLAHVVRPVFFSPRYFFREKAGSIGGSAAFGMGLLMGGAGAMAGLFWGVLLGEGPLGAGQGGADVWSLRSVMQGLFSAPLQVAIRIGVTSLVINMCLFAAGAAKRGLGATFRAVCFGQFPCLIAAIPLVGVPVAFIWSAVLQFIGIKEMHGISYGRAVMALIFFLVFAAGLGLLAALSDLMGLFDIRGGLAGS